MKNGKGFHLSYISLFRQLYGFVLKYLITKRRNASFISFISLRISKFEGFITLSKTKSRFKFLSLERFNICRNFSFTCQGGKEVVVIVIRDYLLCCRSPVQTSFAPWYFQCRLKEKFQEGIKICNFALCFSPSLIWLFCLHFLLVSVVSNSKSWSDIPSCVLAFWFEKYRLRG